MIPASLNTMMMGASNIPILDVVGSSAFAVSSARRLSSSNTSPFLVRRGDVTTGGTTKNAIYTDNNETDQSDLTTFRGANTFLRIQTWYDQSGNSNNATNATWTQEPAIYGNETFSLLNTKLSSYYFASESRNLTLNSAITLASEYVVFMVVAPENNNSQLGGTSAANGGLNAALRCGTTTHLVADSSGLDLTTTGTSAVSVYRGQKLAGDRAIFVNGTEITTTTTTGVRNGTISRIGQVLSGASNLYHEGRISEIIIYNRSMTTDEINTVESNMRDYYGV